MRLWMEPWIPTISSISLRSLQMTSGLFNTGFAGDSAEITSRPAAVQPAGAKTPGHDLEDMFDSDLLEGLGDFSDPLGDVSMDSFINLSQLLGENSFLGQEGTPEAQDQADLQTEVKVKSKSLKRPFSEVDSLLQPDMMVVTADAPLIPTTVMDKSPTHDHDYIAKRPRMSTLVEESSVEMEEEEESIAPPVDFLAPTPSTSQIVDEAPSKDKYLSRREKNNIASKRSREIRKNKFANMEQEAERLEEENKRLEAHIVELERLAKQMKEILVAKMAGKA